MTNKPLILNNIELDFSKETFIMGILNVTPDSFSDGGSYSDLDAALYRAETMIAEGAAIITKSTETTTINFTPTTLASWPVNSYYKITRGAFRPPTLLNC